jgi:glycosylphosphatidylinositol transamidase (GPIT) subunit GPI8
VIFHTLISKNLTSRNAIISDSCGAITPFEKVVVNNFLAMGSSSLTEKSLSHGFDTVLNLPKSDDFSFYFDEVLREKAVVNGKSNLNEWTFTDLLKYMDKSKLKVTAKLIANGVSKHQKLSTFVVRKNP